jgi:hypothetical protein
MGPAALIGAETGSDNRATVDANGQVTVLREIEELLRTPRDGAGAPTLARLETTLTDGYAQALALELERLRLERRLGEVAREREAPDPEELASIGSRLTWADGELARLRGLLVPLRERRRLAAAAQT